jgi:hypothetical protein
MSSDQDFAGRLQDEVRRALADHLLSFEEEYRTVQTNLSASISAIDQIGKRLETIPSINASSVAAILAAALGEVSREGTRKIDEEKSFLAHFAHDLRRKETQEEILNSLLDGAHRYAPRIVLFVTRVNQFIGWSSRGFSEDTAQRLGGHALSFSESHLLQSALEADGLTTANDVSQEAALAQFLTEGMKGPWHAFPLKAIHRPVAVLLASATDGGACDLESLCVLMDLTGLCIENMALKILHDMKMPSSSAPAAAPGPPAAEDAGSPDEEGAEGESESGASETVRTAGAEILTLPGPGTNDMPEEAPDSGIPTAFRAEIIEPQAEILEPVSPAPAAMAAEAAEASAGMNAAAAAVEEPVEEMVAEEPAIGIEEPVAEVAPAAAEEKSESARPAVLREVQPLTEEEKLHADAKRFARLLATEIKLYNEQRVQEGRENKDIYVRLKRDIDRSRDMYEKRISPQVSRKVDYFHDEIIRVLGDNDPSVLGSDYPGPRVES